MNGSNLQLLQHQVIQSTISWIHVLLRKIVHIVCGAKTKHRLKTNNYCVYICLSQ
jgi:hypothetical protein